MEINIDFHSYKRLPDSWTWREEESGDAQ